MIGFIGNEICRTIGLVVLTIYVFICLSQLSINVIVFYQKSDDSEVNSFLQIEVISL